MAGGGGLLWNEDGRWIVGFARKIGITSSFLAELWALRDGLSLCVSRNFAAVEIELDAKSIVDAMVNQEYSNILASSLMDDCRNLAKQIPRIRVKHCFREANRCADALARMGGLLDDNFTVFKSPFVDISSFLDFDCNGLFLSRFCPVSLFSL
ncbi:hypothetical protein SO802_019105 [Lithocarpus litseifolius]|uniref:RNase H type-1 domain-containing protein n=1 Tax=Lithocarpus litseifolius TaxID=425828 RepID=A0AAW2CPP4_9ROSI